MRQKLVFQEEKEPETTISEHIWTAEKLMDHVDDAMALAQLHIEMAIAKALSVLVDFKRPRDYEHEWIHETAYEVVE